MYLKQSLTWRRWPTKRICGYQKQSGRSREHVPWRSWVRDNQKENPCSMRLNDHPQSHERTYDNQVLCSHDCTQSLASLFTVHCLSQATARTTRLSRTFLFTCKCCETSILLPSLLNSHFDGVSTTTCCISPAVRAGASMNVEGMPCPSTSGTVIPEARSQSNSAARSATLPLIN